jgi:hypothetical protein
MNLRQIGAFCAALTLALCHSACSSSSRVDENRKPVHPVKGKVLVQGKPAARAFVLFVPVKEPAEAPDPRPRADAADDGSFELSTYGEKDGAPAGEYIVTVTWPGGVLPDGREEPADKLLGRYENVTKSKLRATVKEGQNDLPPFQLQ